MYNVKTIDLTGGETKIEFKQSFNSFLIKNCGGESVYASMKSGISPDADGVLTVASGESEVLYKADSGMERKLYLMGNGKVQVMGRYMDRSPFKVSGKGGDSGGGSGTKNYNDLSDQPKVNGKTLKGNMSFEQLGWYGLTKDDAVEIFNNAVKKLDPYDILAEIPLNGSIDGYGYSILNKGDDVKSNLSGGGLYLTTASYLNVGITKVHQNEPYIISFDCKMDSIVGNKEIFFIALSSSYIHLKNVDGKYALYRSSASSAIQYIISGTEMPSDNEWHHIDIMLSHDNSSGYKVKIKYLYDGKEAPEYDQGVGADNAPFNNFYLGYTSYPYNGYIKNVVIKTPKEAD